MPATSRVQRIATAIAEHHPEQLYARNRGLLNMSHSQLHDFAATPETDLPERAASPDPMSALKAAAKARANG